MNGAESFCRYWGFALLVSFIACDARIENGGDGNGGAGAGGEDAAGGEDVSGGGPLGGGPLGGGQFGGFAPEPGPYTPPTGCELVEIVVEPSVNSPTDGCAGTYQCDGGVVLLVECDGENDGTYTSLCTCDVNGSWHDGGLVEGEGEPACLAGFANCTAQK
ncbi:MAG: hypothetical protein HOW73_45880 [Polyangiaceae bacterium]|nr:hypothetical protein [Polyangiaceae bacterium]